MVSAKHAACIMMRDSLTVDGRMLPLTQTTDPKGATPSSLRRNYSPCFAMRLTERINRTLPLCQMTGHTNRDRVRAKRASVNKPKSSSVSSSEEGVVGVAAASPMGTIISRG